MSEILKLISTSDLVAQLISFLMLYFVLRKFAWNKILGFLDQRKEKIRLEFQAIEKAKADITALGTAYQKQLDSIQEVATRTLNQAVHDGRALTDEIRKKANLEAQDIINNAQQNIKYEMTKAKEELRERIVYLTMASVERIFEGKLTGEQDNKIIYDFLDQMEAEDDKK